MLPDKLAFVDLETTGCSASYNRIIEIGIIRVENNKLVKTFHSLINPKAHLPKEIEYLTGITQSELENAPTFRAIKDEILEILDGCYFVAHNVRFDYGFLKSEFKRENKTYSQKHFCTVRLSRLLYPEYKHHNLDSIIDRFEFGCKNRHRALDDAQVLFDFYKKMQKTFSAEMLDKAIAKCLKKTSTPLKLSQTTLENLPEQPGVYIFYADAGMPLYVGKSVNIKDRVLSHFSSDINSSTEMKIAQQVASIETITTAGELGALLLESSLIKKMLPLYNKISRVKHELVAIKSKTNKDGYLESYLEPINILIPDQILNQSENSVKILGFFKSKRQAREYLSIVAKKYMLCEKLLGLEKTSHACFAYRLKKCAGACLGNEKPELYNIKFITAFTEIMIKPWPFKGAVVITESGIDEQNDHFLIDKWCYLGKVEVDEWGNTNNELTSDTIFDLDTYKILKRFLQNPKNVKSIRPNLSNQVAAL